MRTRYKHEHEGARSATGMRVFVGLRECEARSNPFIIQIIEAAPKRDGNASVCRIARAPRAEQSVYHSNGRIARAPRAKQSVYHSNVISLRMFVGLRERNARSNPFIIQTTPPPLTPSNTCTYNIKIEPFQNFQSCTKKGHWVCLQCTPFFQRRIISADFVENFRPF